MRHRSGRSTGRPVGTFVGLDIGSSAVRAAEVIVEPGRRTLRRVAQVELPRGAVVDGEVIEVATVGQALTRLWDEGSFSTRKVIVGISSQRVIVRPAEVAAMPEEDFRLALQFEAQDLIPIPSEEAVLDFTVLERPVDEDAATGNARMRILLAAAHRDMLRNHLEALKLAGLEALAVDVVPLALLRAVPGEPGRDDGTDAVVSLGSDLTTVAIRENGAPRFTRTVGLGGSKLTNSIASDLSFEADEAEGIKRQMDAPVAVMERVRHVLESEIRPIISEVNGSLDYFLAQSDRSFVDRVLVTGGASQTEGLLDALSRSVEAPVALADPFVGLRVEDFGLGGAVAAQALAPIGIALWGTELPERRLSLLPPEVLEGRRQRRANKLAAVGLAVLAVVLGGVWAMRHFQVAGVNHQVAGYSATNAALKGQLGSLSNITALKSQIASDRSLATTALNGEVDWMRLLGQIAAVLPSDEWITSFNGTAQTGTGPVTAAPGAPAGLGTVQLSLSGRAGQESVAQWLRAVAKIPAFDYVTVGASSSSATADSFTSTADVGKAGAGTRATTLPGAKP